MAQGEMESNRSLRKNILFAVTIWLTGVYSILDGGEWSGYLNVFRRRSSNENYREILFVGVVGCAMRYRVGFCWEW